MNINKIIFIILAGIITVSLIFLALNLQSNDSSNNSGTTSSDIKIWILDDDEGDFNQIINTFKDLYPDYKSKNIKVDSFSDKVSYDLALTSAFLQGKGPDVFVLNSTEVSPFENMVLGVNPAAVSPNDFRLRYAPVFGEELILSDSGDANTEFLKGIPVGFQSLGIFYNRKYFLRPSEMTTWSGISTEIQSIAKKYSGSIIPIALGNGKGVSRSSEVMQALFALEGSNSLVDLDSNEVRDVVSMYKALGERSGDNRYSSFSENSDDSDVTLFSEGKVAAIVGYPRDLIDIDKAGYQKTFLFATPFPAYSSKDKITAIEYNYFSINKDSTNQAFALDFLTYLSSSEGQQKYIDTYPYYLSPELSILTEQQEKKILSGYNVVYKNFLEDGSELVSFNVENKNIFDSESKNILDIDVGANESFFELKNFIICANEKQSTLGSLSSPCR